MRHLNPRDELLVEGLRDSISLAWLHDYFEYDFTSDGKAQERTLDMIGDLVGQGFFVVGTPASFGFHQWLMPLEEALEEIKTAYVDHFDHRESWAETIALYQTAKGKQLGAKLCRGR
ncbi:hypothetical protein BH10ACT9_BH10ACT9_43960 [soil metagenome]